MFKIDDTTVYIKAFCVAFMKKQRFIFARKSQEAQAKWTLLVYIQQFKALYLYAHSYNKII